MWYDSMLHYWRIMFENSGKSIVKKNPILAEKLSKNGCTLLYFGIKISGNMNHIRNLSKNS